MSYPKFCYSHDLGNNCTIIRWGESGYCQTNYPEGKYNDEVIDMINKKYLGISKRERNAMECCSMVAQENPDLNWEEHYDKCL